MERPCASTPAALLEEEHITAFAAIPYAACRVLRPYLAERLSFVPQTAVLFLVPYYAGEGGNISAYAAARDYHLYMRGLFARITPRLAESGYSFAGFADHSPIDERHAAALAGLGMLGKNGLLIHPRYGSYVFIGELLTDAPPAVMQACEPKEPAVCEDCGACCRACPTGALESREASCLSAVTQKKGVLSEEEIALIRKTGQVWGCDACQIACPHNRRSVESGEAETPIPFFREDRIPHLEKEVLVHMTEAEFSERAFSFRGREVPLRNLCILRGEDAPST